MNCREKTRYRRLWLFAAMFIFTLGTQELAVAQEEHLSSYPPLFLSVMNQLSRWKPDKYVSDECQRSFSSGRLSPSLCEANEHYNLNLLDSYKSKLLFDFDLSDREKFQKMVFEPQPGYKFRALLGLHKNQKRPLVIFRMGVHGNIDEFLAERFLIKLLYEDLNYHVLTIESTTSHGYLKINEKVGFGGVEEGLQTFYVVNMLTHHKLPWASQISTLHLAGVSLSGAGLFLTTYLDEQSEIAIKSVQMFCPLVNVEKTFAYHFQPSLKEAFIDFWNSRRLKEMKNKSPELAQLNLWPMLFDWRPRFVPTLLKWFDQHQPKPLLDVENLKKQFPRAKFSKEFEEHLQRSTGLYQLNDFWPIFKNEKTPIHIAVTPEDPLVINSLNAQMIEQGQQPGFFHKTTIEHMKGLHCAFAAEYQWPFLVEWIRRGFEL